MKPRPWPRLLALVALVLAAHVPARSADRADVEAAIVYNLLLFVDWPSDAVAATGGPLVLCVDPGSPLAPPLKTLGGRPVRGWRLQVRELAAGASPAGCNALFLDEGSRASWHALRPQLKGAPVLVIDDADGELQGLAAIHLDTGGDRIAFDVNLAAARDARLQISSRLLRLARKVTE